MKSFIDYVNQVLGGLVTAEGLNKYAKNTSWLLLEKILRLFLSFFISIWVARYLGPEQFGILSYAISLVALFAAIPALGLENVIVKKLSLPEHPRANVMGTAFVLRLIGTVTAILAIICIAVLLGTDRATTIVVIIVSISLFMHPFMVVESYFRFKVQAKYIALSSSIAILVGALLRVLLILTGRPLTDFAVVIAVEAAIASIAFVVFYQRADGSIFKWRINLESATELLRECWPLLFSGAMIAIYMRIDQVMIEHMLGSSAVGHYSVAVRLSELWYFIPVVICQSTFPSILQAKSTNPEQYTGRMQILFEFLTVMALIVSISIYMLSSHIVPFLYGTVYAPAAKVLNIHVWSSIFVAIGTVSSNWLLAENLQKYQLISLIFGALVNVICNVIFIRLWQIQGAALATLLSYVFSAYLGLLFFKKTRPCFIMSTKAFLPLRLLRIRM